MRGTIPAPWHGGRRGARLRRQIATTTLVLAFVLAAGTVVAAATELGAASPFAGAPAPHTSLAVPAADQVDRDVDPRPVDVPAAEPKAESPPPSPAPVIAPETVADDPDPSHLDDGAELAAVQTRLQELGYLLGAADGVKGQQTVAAVMAFQRVNGLQVDGVIGPITLAALDSPAEPELAAGPATRIEVDLTRQLLHVVEEGQRTVTLHVSSGNGEAYPSASGGSAYARTPVGTFRVERRIHGVRESRLGTLYDPLYFHAGFAVHGSPSVPAYPASHGCVRVTRADAAWLVDHIADDTPVLLYGGTHVFSPSGA